MLGLFAVQHSVMARPGFKAWWTKIIPKPIERSTFVWLTSVILLFTFWQWRSMGETIWSVESTIGSNVLVVISMLGWLTVLVSTFLLDHFELFGLRQVLSYWKNQTIPPYTLQDTFFL